VSKLLVIDVSSCRSAHGACDDVRVDQANILAAAFRAFQKWGKMPVKRAMFCAKLVGQRLDIKLGIMTAIIAIRSDKLPVFQTRAQSSICAVTRHSHLRSGGDSYIRNETETNNFLEAWIE